MWRKTMKKLGKAKTEDLRAALDELDSEAQQLDAELGDLKTRLQDAELAVAQDEKPQESPASIREKMDEAQSKRNGLDTAKEKLEAALSQAEQSEQQERRKALEAEQNRLREAKGQKYNEAMELLAKASCLLWEVKGGQEYGFPGLVTEMPKIEMHKDPTFRAERSRLQEQAPEKSIETRLKQIQLELQELRG